MLRLPSTKCGRGTLSAFRGKSTVDSGISADNLPSQNYWATEVPTVEQSLLSEFLKSINETYGILMPSGVANRATFVVDRDGTIQFIEEGFSAVDSTGAMTACSRLKH